MKLVTRAFFGASLLALLGAAALHTLLLFGLNMAWGALVHLTLFGWISGMIFAVNYHTMPVFAARDFPEPRLIWAHLAAFASGVIVAVVGYLVFVPTLIALGLALELLSALLFTANTILLFTHGPQRAHRPPPPPIPGQPDVDRIGTQATKAAGLCLPLTLLLLLLVRIEAISGLWLLAAEHLAALGWVLLMIVGVAYHVLPRFSGQATRGAQWARLQLGSHLLALALIVLALGFGWGPLFAIGGLVMSFAVGLFAWVVWPTLKRLEVSDWRLESGPGFNQSPTLRQAQGKFSNPQSPIISLEERRK